MRTTLRWGLLLLLLLPESLAQTVPLTLEVTSPLQANSSSSKSTVQEDLSVAEAQSVAGAPSQPIPITGLAAAATTSSKPSLLLRALLGIAVFLVIFLIWRR